MITQWTAKQAVYAVVACLSVITPAQAAGIDDQVNRISNESLVWGPFRPNLYFGVRPRIPKSLISGLLWTNVDNFQNAQTSMAIF